MTDAEKDRQRRALNEVIKQISSPDSPYGYSMIPAVKRFILYAELDSQVEPIEVLTEAYLRGMRATDAGTQINSCRAWIKGACRLIVFEMARQRRRERSTDPQSRVLEVPLEPENDCENRFDRNSGILRQAFEQLKATEPENAELLEWRFLQNMSWQAIRDRLYVENKETPSLEALRQRASRTNRKLRRIFHELGGNMAL